jgi:predicted enzyme related to lactoylglutathione lyase
MEAGWPGLGCEILISMDGRGNEPLASMAPTMVGMAKVTGLGGAFFRTPDPRATSEWYRTHLGLDPESDHPSATFRWSGGETSVWGPFPDDTDYFGTSDQQFMINFRVDDLQEMLAQLRAAGVSVDDAVEDSEFGIFGWATDCDGRRFELWQAPEGS